MDDTDDDFAAAWNDAAEHNRSLLGLPPEPHPGGGPMTARDDVIVALAKAYEDLPAGELNGFRLGRMLDTVPTDTLVRLANERRMTQETDR